MSENDKADKQATIHIDKKTYKVTEDGLTGAQLRALPDPAISSEYQLKLQVPGSDDITVEDDQVVELKNGMHFFSIPKNINPGQ